MATGATDGAGSARGERGPGSRRVAGAFGVRLRGHRLAVSLSQEELAARAGVSVRAVSDLERGVSRVPHPSTVRRLADALGLAGAARDALLAAGLSPAALSPTDGLSPTTALPAGGGVPAVPSPRDAGAPAAVIQTGGTPAPLSPTGGPSPAAPSPATVSAPLVLAPLPVPPTGLVGREQEVAGVRRLLDGEPAGTRLLTLTGPGGVGKTRLALAVAGEASRAGEAAFVDLAPLASAALVPQAVAAVLGVPEQPGRSLADTLGAAVGGRALLLVLDNCEHLLDACAALAEGLLAACPGLRLLATSREPLGVPGETVRPVPALALPAALPPEDPPEADVETPASLASNEAVRLFVDRARAAAPGFALTPQNAGAVGEVCRRLEGLPLALELVAPRVRALDVAELAARLDHRLGAVGALAGARRGGPPRQRTLRATLDWSYDLLLPEERVLFRRLAVFAGGFDLAAAEAVCADAEDGPPDGDAGAGVAGLTDGDTGAGLVALPEGDDGAGAVGLPEAGPHEAVALPEREVAGVLARLVDRSLVLSEAPQPGARRYRLLEIVREYAAERLVSPGRVDAGAAVRRRHADYFAALAEQAEPALRGPRQAEWAARAERDAGNVRAALGWSLESGEVTLALRLAAAQSWFWQLRGHFAEGQRWLEAALSMDTAPPSPALPSPASVASSPAPPLPSVTAPPPEPVPPASTAPAVEATASPPVPALPSAISPLRACAIFWLGLLVWLQGDLRQGRAHIEASVAQLREGDDPVWLGFALSHLSQLVLAQGDLPAARRLAEEAVALLRPTGDPWALGVALTHLGDVYSEEGDAGGARGLYEESAALLRRAGDATMVALPLAWSAQLAAAAGDYEAARAGYEAALAAARTSGHLGFAGIALRGLGELALRGNDADRAAMWLAENLTLQRRMGRPVGVAQALAGLGAVAVARGEPVRAARLLGAATSLREGAGVALDAAERATYGRAAGAARSALGDTAFAAAWAAGAALTPEEAIAEATAPADPSRFPARKASSATSPARARRVTGV